jgi:hypothetical protein
MLQCEDDILVVIELVDVSFLEEKILHLCWGWVEPIDYVLKFLFELLTLNLLGDLGANGVFFPGLLLFVDEVVHVLVSGLVLYLGRVGDFRFQLLLPVDVVAEGVEGLVVDAAYHLVELAKVNLNVGWVYHVRSADLLSILVQILIEQLEVDAIVVVGDSLHQEFLRDQLSYGCKFVVR